MAGFRDAHSGRRRKNGPETSTRSHQEWQQLCGEFNICKRKLQAKSDALLVLAKELDNVRQEKDAYKLMAEQLREKFHEQRKKYEERERALGLSLHDGDPLAERRNHTLVQILCESRAKNRKAELELADLRQKLSEAEGDIKLLRESIARQRIGDEGIGTRHFPAHEREELIRQLEKSREQIESLERDMVAKIDDQQEFVTERDYYRTKTERLNQELNYVLGGDDRRIIDVDALVMENKYLKERMNQSLEEKATLQATINKYKTALERRRGKGITKPGGGSGAVLSTKDVENLLAQGKSGGISASPSSVGDLQALATSLLETVHDKNMALSHQKNTNKILGKRVAELEKKLKTLEVAGLWTLPVGSGAGARNAAFLAKEKQNMASGLKTLLPHQVSSSSDDSPRSLDGNLSQGSSTRSTPHSTPSHGIGHKELSRKDTEDSLILLEETDGTAEATESRSRSQSSPTRHDQVGVELTRRDTDRNLVAVEGQKTLVKVRSMSQDSPSHRCHQTDLVKADTENSLITLEDNHENCLEEDSSSDPWQVPPGEKRTSEDDEGSGRCIDINDRDASGGGDARGNVNASAERALLKNIFEIERGRADGSDDHLDDVTCNGSNKDDEETLDAAIEPEDQETDLQEEGDKLMSSWMEADGDPSTGATISTSSLENLFDSVADRLTLKNKEKIPLERTESTQPSSPLLKRDKPTHLVVVDNTPQCV
nr:coiled-coil domain-containing protein 149-B-like [Lytechinus pictus]